MLRPPLLRASQLGLSVVRISLILVSHSAEASTLQSSAYAALLVCRLYCGPH